MLKLASVPTGENVSYAGQPRGLARQIPLDRWCVVAHSCQQMPEPVRATVIALLLAFVVVGGYYRIHFQRAGERLDRIKGGRTSEGPTPSSA